MKTGATFPTIFARQKFIFLVLVCLLLFSFFSGNAQIAGSVGVHTNTPNSLFEVNGSFGQNITTVTTTGTTLGTAESIVICNNGSTAITETLPTAVGITGRMYTIKKGTGSTADVTIDAAGSETIDGALTLVLSDDQGGVTIVSDGAGWKIISKYLSPYPMGEVSYFSITGTSVTISAVSDGSTNMVVCHPTTTLLNMADFDNGGSNNGRLRYIGKTPRTMHIALTLSASPAASQDEFVFGVAKNGTIYTSSKIIQRMGTTTDAQSTAIHVAIPMIYGDYLELYVGNLIGARNVTIKSLNLFALGM